MTFMIAHSSGGSLLLLLLIVLFSTFHSNEKGENKVGLFAGRGDIRLISPLPKSRRYYSTCAKSMTKDLEDNADILKPR
jgi:hypothetical protein